MPLQRFQYLLVILLLLDLPLPTRSNAQTYSATDKVTTYGCSSYKYCNGHGTCLYSRNECVCEAGWGSPGEVLNLGFRPSYDCSKKVCPMGHAWGDAPESNSTNSRKTTTDMAHGKKECSDMGF